MDRTGAACYVYAKASGMLAKSFVGSKAVKLFNVKSLQELWSLLFTDEVPVVPQTILAQKIEKKAAQRFINEYIITYLKLIIILILPHIVYSQGIVTWKIGNIS